MKKAAAIFLAVVTAFSLIGASGAQNGENTLDISADNIAYDISENLYGLFIEDINYACDGGLVSNLINNNSFEYPSDNLTAWHITAGEYKAASGEGMNENNSTYLSVKVSGSAEITNNGFHEIYDYKTWDVNEKKVSTPDIGYKKGGEYLFSAYFKNIDFKGTLTACLDAKGNSGTYSFNIDGFEDWKKVELTLTSEVTADGAFTITADGNGTFLMDFVSLIPADSHGLNDSGWKYVSLRADLYETLEQLSPKFIRFPGGCLAEGDSLENLYNWKDTIGPLEQRVQTYNLWRDDAYSRQYINTNSMGYYEYFMLCDDLGAEPIPVLNAGITCQARNGYGDMSLKYANGEINEEEWQAYLDTIALRPGTKEFESYVQDILDLIEFANGAADSEWGKARAESGHSEPFNMKYIAVGNENWGEVYWRNFEPIYNAVKERYPGITVVTTAGAWLEGEDFDYAWETANSKYPDTVVDEHYYTVGGYLFDNTHRYDSYERSGAKAFIGEYAPKSDGYGTLMTKSNIWAAVESAAYMTGIERNADVVEMVAYAPAFAKLNAQSWDVNLIWFDSQEVVCSPDYYAQMLFSNNMGTKYVTTDFNMEEEGIYHSVTVDTDEQVLYVKLVNSNTKSEKISINLTGFENAGSASVQYMSEIFKAACNEVGEPLKVAPREKELEIQNGTLEYDAGSLSVSVIRIPYGDNDGSSLYELPDMGIIMPYVHIVIEIAVPCTLALIIVVSAAAVLISKRKRRVKKSKSESGKTE